LSGTSTTARSVKKFIYSERGVVLRSGQADGSGASSDRCRPGRQNYLPFLPFFLLFLLFLATRITSFLAREVNDVLTTRVNISLTYAGCRYAVTVASKNLTRRITAALGDLDVADGPMSRLDAARRLREAADELEAAQVEAARKAGATWSEIGSCYGLTKQGAQQRFRAARHQAKADAAAGAEAPGRRAGSEPG
jgi:hypothetical protein